MALEVVLDGPLRCLVRAICTPGFGVAALWGYKEWQVGVAKSPYPMYEITYLPFSHKACRSAPLSRPGLVTGTQKICALVCIPPAALGTIHLCHVFTLQHALSLPSAPT